MQRYIVQRDISQETVVIVERRTHEKRKSLSLSLSSWHLKIYLGRVGLKKIRFASPWTAVSSFVMLINVILFIAKSIRV